MMPRVEPHRLTVHDVAHRLSVHDDTVRRWISDGELQAINIGTAERPIYRISESSVTTFCEKRAPQNTRQQ